MAPAAQRFLSVMALVAVLGAAGACSDSTSPAASPGASSTSAAAVASASPSPSAFGNTKEICAAAALLVNDDNINLLTKKFGDLITARKLKNAELEATAKNAIQTQAGSYAKQLGDLGARANDPALRTALGTMATALTTLATDQSLAGVTTFEDAARLAGPLGAAQDALTKACG